jgi:hypothetical protein
MRLMERLDTPSVIAPSLHNADPLVAFRNDAGDTEWECFVWYQIALEHGRHEMAVATG